MNSKYCHCGVRTFEDEDYECSPCKDYDCPICYIKQERIFNFDSIEDIKNFKQNCNLIIKDTDDNFKSLLKMALARPKTIILCDFNVLEPNVLNYYINIGE